MKREIKFLISIIGSGLATVVAVILFNLVMDPYRAYQLIDIPGINQSKPKEMLSKSKSKVRDVAKLKPATLILGTSRAELGLDPDHKVLVEGYPPVYNMALPTSNIVQHLRILKFVQGKGELKRVLLGLDFSMFNASRLEKNKLDSRLENVLREQETFAGVEHFNNLLTFEALSDSYHTLTGYDVNNLASENRHTERGLRNPGRWLKAFSAIGHQGMFSHTERKFFRRGVYRSKSDSYFEAVKKDTGNGGNTWGVKKVNTLDVFSNFLVFCAENKIELNLFISPLHARHQNIIVAENRWQDFELWKRRMTDAVHAVNSEYGADFVLWDFSPYSHVTTESVPSHRKTEMRWFWESEHYKIVLGSHIIDIMLGRSVARIDGEAFGVVLSHGGVEQHLDDIRRGQADYLGQNPKDLERLKRLKVLILGRRGGMGT